MSDFFGELAKKLAERWLSLLAIPGVLFIATGWIALQLGQSHALDVHKLANANNNVATMMAGWPGATQALAVVGLLLTSIIIGLIVQALVSPVRAACMGQWPHGLKWLERLLTRRRRHRWNKLAADRAALQTLHPLEERIKDQQERIDRLAERINALAMAEPGRATWIGDRVYALTQISINRYGLDLTFSWPRLWLVLPDTVRAEVSDAAGRFAAAVLIITWSLPYIMLGTLWWPSALAGFAVAVVGWSRARTSISSLTELVEAILDVHGRSLAISLGVAASTSTGPLTPDEGQHITDIVRK